MHPADPPRKHLALRRTALILLALTFPTGFWAARCMMPNDPPKPPTAAGGEITVGGVPLFATWPQGVKPEVAIVLTGQTNGYLSPCGCSHPQKGGIERRTNLLKDLRAKGWPVVAVDLGDIAPTQKVKKQDDLKYKTAMKAYDAMGYAAVGVGMQEFKQQFLSVLQLYALQTGNTSPALLSANLQLSNGAGGFDRTFFEPAGQRPIVGSSLVVSADRRAGAKPLGHLPVGVAAVLGPATEAEIKKYDKEFAVADVAATLTAVVAGLKDDPKKPAVNVLLYNGSKDDTPALATKFPEFNVILCQSDDPEPPQFPTLENNGRTFVIQTGHKGQNVGIVGVFKNGNGYELKYQLVPIGPEFASPDGPEAEKANPALQLMADYTAQVKKDNLLAEYVGKPIPHEAQIANPAANLTFVGSAKCQTCHPNEFTVWEASKHSHAMEALEHAVRPGNRQFDGDCVQCHTVGFGYQTGYTSDKATPQLRHVGCESCHGPGSGHAAQPNNAQFRASLSQWKSKPADKLPAKTVLEKLAAAKPGDTAAVPLTPAESLLINTVTAKCYRCHDQENDPKFKFAEYMPKVWHSGFKAVSPPAGGNAAVPVGK